MLVGRYRVVERVGRGGMGEVYRAEDLKLGQPVALKFLSNELNQDAGRLQALFAEVRLARQISHVNVCRVHDIVEMEGTHSLSMEYVDGEDMGSLLRRIGRLPLDKAVMIAYELCAGLAAIHDHGVLHRDLKPANVMLDGRGHARITDFGLAILQGSDPDTIAGTPAYMAPETLSGGHGATIRSDLYSLGLVMYELFTGRPAFQASAMRELIRERTETVPMPPSQHQRDLPPEVDRLILRCLERDPLRRPQSAREVAAALPGGDSLAATIAMGETPSPELVAAATQGAEGMRRGTAWSWLGALVVGLALVMAVSPRTRLVPKVSLPEPPEAMAARAREVLREHGYTAPAFDRAFGYDFDESAIDRIVATNRSPSRWETLSTARPPVVTFWYRESPAALVAAAPWYRVSYTDPPWRVGMVGVKLDGLGRLEGVDAPAGSSLPLAAPSAFDGARDTPADASANASHFVGSTLRPALLLAAILIGAWLARRNLRAGRGDTRRALRVASAMMAIRILAWLLGAHHTAGSATEQVTAALAWGLYDFAYGWLFYIAIEPYVRRFWPRMLTSWARLVDGQHADARVGQDLLMGCLVGTVIALLVAAHQAAPVLFGAPPGRPDNVGYVEHQLAFLLGTQEQLAEVFGLLRSNIVLVMGFMVVLVTARILLRRTPVALVASFLIFVSLALPKGEYLALNLGLAVGSTLILLWVMMQFGLLAMMIGLVTYALLQSAPLGMGMGSWQANRTVLVSVTVLGVGLYGFSRSLGSAGAIRDVPAEE
jgi:hypothetical protein